MAKSKITMERLFGGTREERSLKRAERLKGRRDQRTAALKKRRDAAKGPARVFLDRMLKSRQGFLERNAERKANRKARKAEKAARRTARRFARVGKESAPRHIAAIRAMDEVELATFGREEEASFGESRPAVLAAMAARAEELEEEFEDMTAKESIVAIRDMGAEELAEARTIEESRAKPRTTVIAAIVDREEELAAQ